MIKTIAIGAAIALAALLLYAATRPDTFRVQRTVKDVGKGSIRIVDSAPRQVTMRLDMLEPFEGHNTVEFRLAPQGDTTAVTWAMHGPNPFLAKLMGVFLNMDRMIGRDFEAGLADLKARAERA